MDNTRPYLPDVLATLRDASARSPLCTSTDPGISLIPWVHGLYGHTELERRTCVHIGREISCERQRLDCVGCW